MKKNTIFPCFAVLAFFLVQFSGENSWAAPAKNNYYRPQTAKVQEDYPEYPWYLFLGLDLGYSHYSEYNNSPTESPRGGTDIGLRALLAHYSENWVIDGGLGYQWINNKGTNLDNSVNTDKTTNGYVDLSGRYRLNSNWQIGPELQYWVTTDKGLNPTAFGSNLIADGDNTSFWGGIQGLYEWTDTHKYRLGVRGLYGLNLNSRTVYIAQAFFQFGFDVFSSHPENNEIEHAAPVKHYEHLNGDDLSAADNTNQNGPLYMTPEATPWPKGTPAEPDILSTPAPPAPDVTPMPKKAPDIVMKKSKVIVTLDVNDLPFGFNNSDLPKASADRMVKVGAFLAAHNASWKSLSVQGHTDERGTVPYNNKLSKRRADTVRALLIEGGASPNKIKSVGYGKSRPRDKHHNEKAWAKNRRVEMEFSGMKDMVLMKKAMTQ